MIVEVRLFATLRRYKPDSPNGVVKIDMPESVSVAELVKKLGIDPAEVHMIMVNGISSEPARILLESDRVGLFPAVGGG